MPDPLSSGSPDPRIAAFQLNISGAEPAHTQARVLPPLKPRLNPDGNPTTRPELESRDDAQHRVRRFTPTIAGRDATRIRPTGMSQVTDKQVKQVLNDMLDHVPGVPAGFVNGLDLDPPMGLCFHCHRPVHREAALGLGQGAANFEPAVTLTPKGRQLLARYYANKYAADIVFSPSDGFTGFTPHRDFIKSCRRRGGLEVRRALYLGHVGDVHGSLLVYMREGGRAHEGGKESLLSYDSITDESALVDGEELSEAIADLTQGSEPIEIFQHVRKLQRDFESCWVFAMKTAVTLTGRERGDGGELNDFLVPNLAAALQARRLEGPSPAGVHPIRALPEVVKISQYLETVLADAGGELDAPLHGAKPGMTLRFFMEKYTYTASNGSQLLDYARQKGFRAVDSASIQDLSEQIGHKLGWTLWTPERQNRFAEQMKLRVGGRFEQSVEDNIDALEPHVNDPVQFISQGLKVQAQIHAVLGSIRASQPTLDDLESAFNSAIGQLQRLTATLTRCFAAYDAGKMPVAVGKFREQILPQLHSTIADLQRDLLTVASERSGAQVDSDRGQGAMDPGSMPA
ncbi:hypothetical protein BH11PSE7_BH11PSE7_15130 [soil metagenome]